jgi:hypothetical protein
MAMVDLKELSQRLAFLEGDQGLQDVAGQGRRNGVRHPGPELM